MNLALLSNVGVDLVADLFRPVDEVWLAPGFGAWRQVCLEPPKELVEFAPELVALLIDSSEESKDASRETGDAWREEKAAWRESEETIEALRRALPGAAVVRVDLEDLANEIGPRFFDARIRALAGCPWSLAGQRAIADEIRRLAAVRLAPPKKALAVDFDGVLWRGTLAEDGAQALAPSVGFQRTLLSLKERGVLLVGLTKNDAADIEQAWRNPQMILKRDDFVAIRSDWNEKGANLAETARALNLGMDAFVFADDNPGECAAMAAAHPEVATFLVTEPDAAVARHLIRLHFPDFGATAEDRVRTASYRAEAARRAEASGRTLDDYLASLETVVDFHPARREEAPRLAQLSQRCNQFNVRQSRYSEADVIRIMDDPERMVFSVSVRDRFGDLGIVAHLVVARADKTARLEEWVMSCRAMNRRIENETWSRLCATLRARGVARIDAEVRPTAKNGPVQGFRFEMPDKSAIRREMRARRKALSPEMKARASRSVCDAILARRDVESALKGGGVCAVYLATKDELDLSRAIEAFLKRGVTLVAPRWNGAAYELARLAGLSPDDLRRGPMDVLEPKDARIVPAADVAVWLVPGLAFTREGHRLGYGGGWYDRFLAEASPTALKLGVTHPFQLVEALPAEPHDVRLDGLVVACD